MVTQIRQQDNIINRLLTEPKRFNFFQAVRLLKLYIKQLGLSEDKLPLLRFHTSVKSCFPIAAIESITHKNETNEQLTSIVSMVVSFMGLTGVNGALPYCYTELINQHDVYDGVALKEFFDIFNHRIISLFYASWEKINYQFTLEFNEKKHNDKLEPITNMMASLAGITSETIEKHIPFPAEPLYFYSNVFAGKCHSAFSLEKMLTEYFNIPIRILQFQGQWLRLSAQEYTIIASKNSRKGQFNIIGGNFMLGRAYYDIQSKFRLYVGPVNYDQFKQLEPDGELINLITSITRFYVGMQFDFDIQIELLANDIPSSQLRYKPSLRLGWNVWLKNCKLDKNSNQVIINLVG